MKKNIKQWIFCIFMTFILIGSWCFGSVAQASVQDDFIKDLSPAVIKVAHKYNLYPSVMMAQAALESDFGQSSLAQNADNYFGIKGTYNGQSIQEPTMEYDQKGQPYYVNSSFRKYPNPESSIEDNAKLIRYGIYGSPAYYSGSWRENAADGVTAANSLGNKYASDPNYSNNLVNLIQEYNLNSLLDNAWKRIHINTLKRRAQQFEKKLRRYRKQYVRNTRKVSHRRRTKLHRRAKANNKVRDRAKATQRYHANIIKYQRRYRNKQAALHFVRPTYYKHPYEINAQQLDVRHSYSQILGTNPSVRLVPGKLRKKMYKSNWFAVIRHNVHPTWYLIRNDTGRTVWVAGNSNRPTQYLYYNENKILNWHHRNSPLQNHAADVAYSKQMRRYSWSQVKPRRSQVNINCVAINTQRNNQFWYRINNHHHWFWTNLTAFKD